MGVDVPPRSEVDLVALGDALPQGVAVLAGDGTVVEVNSVVCSLLGRRRADIVGRSVLEFVHPDDVGFAADILQSAPSWAGVVTGPIQFRYLDASGQARTTRIWGRSCLDLPGIDGFVVTISEESSAVLLPAAIRAIAARAPLEEVLGLVAHSFSGHPNLADATVLIDRGTGVEPIGAWPPGSTSWVETPEQLPWAVAWRTGTAVDCDIERAVDAGVEIPVVLRDRLRSLGIESVWCRPVGCSGDPHDRRRADLVVWRRRPGPPSPNQRRSLADAADVICLALEQEAYRRSLERVAYVDPVSGLGNRARFEQILDQHEDRGLDRSAHVAGVVYIDIDGFKEVNDRFGHDAGDQVLAHVAARLRGAVRTHDEVIRVGGDEFVVLCRQPADAMGTESLAARVVEVMARPFGVDGVGTIGIGASVGVEWGGWHLTLRRRIALADEAMLEVKRSGKGGWRRVDGLGGHPRGVAANEQDPA